MNSTEPQIVTPEQITTTLDISKRVLNRKLDNGYCYGYINNKFVRYTYKNLQESTTDLLDSDGRRYTRTSIGINDVVDDTNLKSVIIRVNQADLTFSYLVEIYLD